MKRYPDQARLFVEGLDGEKIEVTAIGGMDRKRPPLTPTANGKRAARRQRSLELLSSRDALNVTLRGIIVRKLDRTEPFGPPRYAPISESVANYMTAKGIAIRAIYFRQRYGRYYFAKDAR